MIRLIFILTLIDGIIEKHHSPCHATPGRSLCLQNPLRLMERHFPYYAPVTSTNSKPIIHHCHVCHSKQTTKPTYYQCKECDKSL